MGYNAIKETWTVDELANKLVQEATRIANAKAHNIPQAHFVHKSEGAKGKGQFKRKDGASIKSSSTSVVLMCTFLTHYRASVQSRT